MPEQIPLWPAAADPALADGPADAPAVSLLPCLADWREQGWLRRLDTAFVRFLLACDPAMPPLLQLSAALLVHMEGRGHTCLRLDDWLREPQAVLGWPDEAAAALRAVLATLPPGITTWLGLVRSSPLVEVESATAGGALSPGTAAGAPLVLHGASLYLRRYWHDERRVVAQVTARSRSEVIVDRAAARHWLDRLFPARPDNGEAAFDWQKAACAIALRHRLAVITGGPGTGKTYTAARLLALLYAVDPAPERLRVALAAPTGKAAARLKQSIETALGQLQDHLAGHLQLAELTTHIGAARTLHSLLGARPDTRAFRFDAAHPLEVDVVIVDEASMVHLEMMAALLDALPLQARVIFLGDKDQLASVEAGAVLGDLCRDAEQGRYRPDTVAYLADTCGQQVPDGFRADDGPRLAQQTVMLRASQRFGGAIGQLALAANRGDGVAASALLRHPPDKTLAWLDTPDPAAAVRLALAGRPGGGGGQAGFWHGHHHYTNTLQARPTGESPQAHADWVREVLQAFEAFRVLCAVRDGEWGATGLNQAIERALVQDGRLSRPGEWYEGRPVLVTRNDPGLGVFNGDIGITLKPPARGAPLRAYFADGVVVRSVAVSRLAHVETAFAMTVHKSQGSEFAHTLMVLPREPSRVLTRELVYTGITRARTAFTLVTGRSAALGEALAHPTRRASGLLARLEAG